MSHDVRVEHPRVALAPLCDAPRLAVADGFAAEDEIAHVLALTADPAALAARGLRVQQDTTGTSCELPVDGDPILEAIRARIHEAAGIDNDLGQTMRFRRYAPGESHPLHADNYTIGDRVLLATAILYLTDCEEGGETRFPRARPPVDVAPRRGRLAVWWNHLPDGRADAAAVHEAMPVRAGEKVTITAFLYKPLHVVRRVLGGAGEESSATNRRFLCVDDGVPEETIRLLRDACLARGLAFELVEARAFDFAPERRASPGDLLFTPAVSVVARHVEQFLFADGVVTFHVDPGGPLFGCTGPIAAFERAGVPIPRTIPCATADRTLLRRFVEELGGLPVVAKILGGSGGIGVVRLDSLASLFSFIDHAVAMGQTPLLSAYVAGAEHHRVVVVGDRAVAAYRNRTDDDDFRTHATTDPADYAGDVDPALARVAVAAARALRVSHAGVDVLRHPSGRLYVLEANFPCYFPQAQLATGVDIAGAMVDHLLAKAAAGAGAASRRA